MAFLAGILWSFLIPPLCINAKELKKAVFIPQWVPQAQFAGYYVALEKGIYQQHGIELEIIQGGPDNPSTDLLR